MKELSVPLGRVVVLSHIPHVDPLSYIPHSQSGSWGEILAVAGPEVVTRGWLLENVVRVLQLLQLARAGRPTALAWPSADVHPPPLPW